MKRVADLQPALDPKTPQGGDVFKRAAARGLIDVPCVPHPMLCGEVTKVGLRLVDDDAGRSGLTLSDSALFEQRDVYARSRKDVRRRTSDRPTADNRDFRA